MIDFHTHILPQIDDGSSSVAMSREMLALEASYGVTAVVLTPHYDCTEQPVADFLAQRAQSFAALQEALPASSPRLFLGAEVLLDRNLYVAENLRALCITGSDYLLIEMPFENWSQATFDALTRVIATHGVRPIIAHLDRYAAMQSSPDNFARLLDLGVTVQLNAEAILPFFSGAQWVRMLAEGDAHLLGSDCHNLTSRSPQVLEAACKKLAKKHGTDLLHRIDAAGRAILGIDE